MYSPGVDISHIGKVKAALRIPVIGNGDIFTAADAIRMMNETGCDGVAVARGALGNPWIFEEIKAALAGENFTPPPIAERVEAALKQFEYSIADKGERTAVVESRRYLGRYIKGAQGVTKIRASLCRASSPDEIRARPAAVKGGR